MAVILFLCALCCLPIPVRNALRVLRDETSRRPFPMLPPRYPCLARSPPKSSPRPQPLPLRGCYPVLPLMMSGQDRFSPVPRRQSGSRQRLHTRRRHVAHWPNTPSVGVNFVNFRAAASTRGASPHQRFSLGHPLACASLYSFAPGDTRR
jgi:hypothetical protein